MERKRIYTKKLGSTVARSARSGLVRFHVISSESTKWSVVSEGSTRALKAFPTRDQAINFAKETASRKIGEVIIHAESGQIADTISYLK
ncbi:DUF2188 domain-containing protein [Flavobacterium sp. ZT3P35]|uniref:DUF2188 domain-containing protein n=1 Tax=Flavobacterium sp. ZT3P35 TaxID=3401727 RepID=UPI003AAE4483